MRQFSSIENSRYSKVGATEHSGNYDYVLNASYKRLGYYDSKSNRTYDMSGKFVSTGDSRMMLLGKEMSKTGTKW